MSNQSVFVLYDSTENNEICGVFSSLFLAENAMNEIAVDAQAKGHKDLYLHIFEVSMDSFERITIGWDQVLSFSFQDEID